MNPVSVEILVLVRRGPEGGRHEIKSRKGKQEAPFFVLFQCFLDVHALFAFRLSPFGVVGLLVHARTHTSCVTDSVWRVLWGKEGASQSPLTRLAVKAGQKTRNKKRSSGDDGHRQTRQTIV